MSASLKTIFPYGESRTCVCCRLAEVHRILTASALDSGGAIAQRLGHLAEDVSTLIRELGEDAEGGG